MKRILVTGATGNIGRQVIKFLFKDRTAAQVAAGVRDLDEAKQTFPEYPQLELVRFDFQNIATYDKALAGFDTVFLLRPPNIASTDKVFKPLVAAMKRTGVKNVMFLSVQGADKTPFIPHHSIEKVIQESGLNYVFLRPSYFMQNLTTTLRKDIREKRKIILPAGEARFTWIDVQDIGEVAAKVLVNFAQYQNQGIVLTGSENKDFYEVTEIINEVVDTNIEYMEVNPFTFYKIKRQDGIARGMILVMIMLHYLQRFVKNPQLSSAYKDIIGKEPTTFREFVSRERDAFEETDKPLLERYV